MFIQFWLNLWNDSSGNSYLQNQWWTYTLENEAVAVPPYYSIFSAPVEYFRKKNVPTMTVRELFNFLVDQTISRENRDKYLEKLQEIASSRLVGEMTDQEKIDEEVFKNMYLPKTLNQVCPVFSVWMSQALGIVCVISMLY